MHSPSSSVRVFQTKITICQQKFAPVIIRRVHHVPFTSFTVSRLRTRSPFVARRLDRHVGLKQGTRVWRYMPRQMLVCCVVSVLPPVYPRPKAVHHPCQLPATTHLIPLQCTKFLIYYFLFYYSASVSAWNGRVISE